LLAAINRSLAAAVDNAGLAIPASTALSCALHAALADNLGLASNCAAVGTPEVPTCVSFLISISIPPVNSA
jgi:hypothetical protein